MRIGRSFFPARSIPLGRPGDLAGAIPAGVAPSRAGPRWGLLANADFRRLWVVGLVVFSVRWLEMIVVGVFVYQRTGSAFDVALMTMLRMLPMALFGALVGTLAERVERRKALIAVVVQMLATSLCLAALAYAGRLEVWHLAAASFCNGIAWAADNPVRRVMIGEAVGHEQMGAAMSIDVGANNASRMLGPTIGGLLLAGTGISGAFTVSVVCYSIALVAALRVRRSEVQAPPTSDSVLSRMIEGVLLVRRDSRLIGVLIITVIYNVFGWSFTTMIPVIGQDRLHLGASGIGMLASMDGIGSFGGAIAIALYAKPAQYSRLYVGGVLSYLFMVVVFALVPNVVLAGAALLCTGVSNAAFSVMQATLIYLAAPPEMRSRLYGVLSVCIGIGPIGFFAIGMLADATGATAATTITAALGLVAMAATSPWWLRLCAAEPNP